MIYLSKNHVRIAFCWTLFHQLSQNYIRDKCLIHGFCRETACSVWRIYVRKPNKRFNHSGCFFETKVCCSENLVQRLDRKRTKLKLSFDSYQKVHSRYMNVQNRQTLGEQSPKMQCIFVMCKNNRGFRIEIFKPSCSNLNTWCELSVLLFFTTKFSK